MLRAVIEHVLIDFVSDGESVPTHAQIANFFEFSASENFSRGIVWRIEDYRLRRRRKGRGQFVSIERPVRRVKLYESRPRAGENRIGAVVLIERLENDDFIAWIDDGIIEDIIASVEPQQTVISRSGSMAKPPVRSNFSAMALRSDFAPHVMAY